jgi:hypothetical protein
VFGYKSFNSSKKNTGHDVEECSASLSGDEVLNSSNNKYESMEIVGDYDQHARQEGEDEESCRRSDQPSVCIIRRRGLGRVWLHFMGSFCK